MKKLDLNSLYASWKETPSSENWEALGEGLLRLAKHLIRTEFPGRRDYEELIGAGIIRVLSNIEKFTPIRIDLITQEEKECGFQNWAWISMRTAGVDEIRKDKKHNNGLRDPLFERIGALYDPYPELDLKIAISKLPFECQNIIQLRLEGLSNKEIAIKMGLPLRTVERRFKEARGLLQR